MISIIKKLMDNMKYTFYPVKIQNELMLIDKVEEVLNCYVFMVTNGFKWVYFKYLKYHSLLIINI